MGGLGSFGTVLRLAFFAPFAPFIEDWLIPGVESDKLEYVMQR